MNTIEIANELKAKARPALIHAVRAWSTHADDESPLCGISKDDPTVWGHRTIYHAWVTCKNCLAKLGKS